MGMRYSAGLRLSYRRGKLMAAYLALPERRSVPVARSREAPEGLVVDYDKEGHEIGIEIVDPCPEVLEELLKLTRKLGVPNAEEEVDPLRRELAREGTDAAKVPTEAAASDAGAPEAVVSGPANR